MAASLLRIGAAAARVRDNADAASAAAQPPTDLAGSDALLARAPLAVLRAYLAQVSRKVTLRLKTGVAALWSRRSATK
ncbi:hypothetical protein [Xanthomonas phaseoli]|uniref:hypothetical protein n=1 Tax=Xanthomonas phaseoli TaxID=1985254 RepID=UPI0002D37697|nr:hypothetical protein [Xanthomonas phaseoli]